MWTSWPNRLFRSKNICAECSGSLASREPGLAIQPALGACRATPPTDLSTCHLESSRVVPLGNRPSCAQQDLDANVRPKTSRMHCKPTTDENRGQVRQSEKNTRTDLPHPSPFVDRFEASCAPALGWATPQKNNNNQTTRATLLPS